MSSTIARRSCQSGSSPGTGRRMAEPIVRSKLSHQASADDRVESRTMASGFASASSRQNAQAGQSTVASTPAGNADQSTGSPRTAACQTALSWGRSIASDMW